VAKERKRRAQQGFEVRIGLRDLLFFMSIAAYAAMTMVVLGD